MRINLAFGSASLDIRLADSFFTRARGLLATSALGRQEGLLIKPCASVHTIGMRYPIDVVFLDRDARVRRVVARLAPWCLIGCPGSRAVLELAAGCVAASAVEPGYQLVGLCEWLH